jgi:5'(3')-deoxyribonucleotidase
MSKPKLLLDVDNVVGDYDRHIISQFHPAEDVDDILGQINKWDDVYRLTGVPVAQAALAGMDHDFVMTIPKLPWADELVAILCSYFDVAFCSALCSDARKGWCQMHWPSLPVILTENKEFLAYEGLILVDDGPHNVDPFNAAGGTGILFPSPHNERRDMHWRAVLHELKALL